MRIKLRLSAQLVGHSGVKSRYDVDEGGQERLGTGRNRVIHILVHNFEEADTDLPEFLDLNELG